jgi:hypothetical protein
MIILLTVIAIVITGVPLAAVALVTVASRREETARSIAGRAPGPLERAARGLLAFHAAGIGRPSCRGRARHQDRYPGQPARDDRFAVGLTVPGDDLALADSPGLASSPAPAGDLALADGPALASSPAPAANPAPADRLALAT